MNDTSGKLTYTEQRDNNLVICAGLNRFWKARGIEANARVVEREIAVSRGVVGKSVRQKNGKLGRIQEVVYYDPPRLVKSMEIVSDISGKEKLWTGPRGQRW